MMKKVLLPILTSLFSQFACAEETLRIPSDYSPTVKYCKEHADAVAMIARHRKSNTLEEIVDLIESTNVTEREKKYLIQDAGRVYLFSSVSAKQHKEESLSSCLMFVK